MFVLVILVAVVNGYPTPAPGPWVQYYEDGTNNFQQNNDIIDPVFYGETDTVTRKPRTLNTLADIVTGGLMAGYNLFDNWIPHLPQKQSKSVSKTLEDPRNFTRPRREEGDTKASLKQSDHPDVIKNITELIQAKIELGNQYKPKQNVGPIKFALDTVLTPEHRILENPVKIVEARSKKTDLDQMIKQLTTALEYIKRHSSEQMKLSPITQNTSTEDLIKHISSSVDRLPKSKNNETRSNNIKEITTALDILLNRMAKSATALINDNSTNTNISNRNIALTKLVKNSSNTSDLMARIVKHVTAAKLEALREKINSGGEVDSAEVNQESFTGEAITGDELSDKIRLVRQKENEGMNSLDGDVGQGNDIETNGGNKDTEVITTKPVVQVTTAAKQESGSQSEEGGGNLVANLLSSFLGSLSKPDGGVDVDAIVGLVSGLSVQKDDGNYDFSGLTDLLQSFLGGDDDGGGGSDVGAFLGGLLGAIIQGSANPPGPQGTGKLTGNLVANILPGLSGPPPPTSSEDGAMAPQQGLDSGSFLAGILSSMLGASSGTSSGGGAAKPAPPMDNGGSAAGSAGFFTAIKNGILKSVFSIITSVLASSSGSSSGKKH